MFRAIQLVILFVLLAVSLVAVAAQGTFTTIDVPGATGTNVTGINPRGDIVGQYTDADGVEHGFLLSGGEFTMIDVPSAMSTSAIGINPEGDIVGAYTSPDGRSHGFLLRKEQ
jgi:probable HAF family extracellular repeat protein